MLSPETMSKYRTFDNRSSSKSNSSLERGNPAMPGAAAEAGYRNRYSHEVHGGRTTENLGPKTSTPAMRSSRDEQDFDKSLFRAKIATLPANFNSNNNNNKSLTRSASLKAAPTEKAGMPASSLPDEASSNHRVSSSSSNGGSGSHDSLPELNSLPLSPIGICCQNLEKRLKRSLRSVTVWIYVLLTVLLASSIVTLVIDVTLEDYYIVIFDAIQMGTIIFFGYLGMIYAQKSVLCFYIVIQFALFFINLCLLVYVIIKDISPRKSNSTEAADFEISQPPETPDENTQSEGPITAHSIFSTIIKSKSTERISCLVNTVLSLVTTILTAIHLRKIHYSLQHPDADMLDQNETLINRSERMDLENSYGTHHRNIYFNDQLQSGGGSGYSGSSRHSDGSGEAVLDSPVAKSGAYYE